MRLHVRTLSLVLALLAFSPLALAQSAQSFRGKPLGSGLFASGTITITDTAMVVDVRRVFSEEKIAFKYKDIKDFQSRIGLFRGRVQLTMSDGKVRTYTAWRASARALSSVLSDRILSSTSTGTDITVNVK